jgi:hypothetical protein
MNRHIFRPSPMQGPLQDKEDTRNSNTGEAAASERDCSKTLEVEGEVWGDSRYGQGESMYKRVVRGIIYRLVWSGGVALMVVAGLEGDLCRSWSACHFLLFLELFAAGFDGDCKTNLGLLLRGKC